MTGSYKLFSLLSLAIVMAVFVMSLFSITYGHPDEDETRGSIDYYLALGACRILMMYLCKMPIPIMERFG